MSSMCEERANGAVGLGEKSCATERSSDAIGPETSRGRKTAAEAMKEIRETRRASVKVPAALGSLIERADHGCVTERSSDAVGPETSRGRKTAAEAMKEIRETRRASVKAADGQHKPTPDPSAVLTA